MNNHWALNAYNKTKDEVERIRTKIKALCKEEGIYEYEVELP